MAERISYPWNALDSRDLLAISTTTKHGIKAVKRALSDDPGHRSKVTADVRRAAANILAHPGPAMKIRLAAAKTSERQHLAKARSQAGRP